MSQGPILCHVVIVCLVSPVLPLSPPAACSLWLRGRPRPAQQVPPRPHPQAAPPSGQGSLGVTRLCRSGSMATLSLLQEGRGQAPSVTSPVAGRGQRCYESVT